MSANSDSNSASRLNTSQQRSHSNLSLSEMGPVMNSKAVTKLGKNDPKKDAYFKNLKEKLKKDYWSSY